MPTPESKSVPPQNWCSTCGRRPEDSLFCSDAFHDEPDAAPAPVQGSGGEWDASTPDAMYAQSVVDRAFRPGTTPPSPGSEGADPLRAAWGGSGQWGAMHKAASDTAPDAGHVKGTGEQAGEVVYAVPTDALSSDGKRELYELHDAPVPMADQVALVPASALAEARAECAESEARLDEALKERDYANDVIQETHIALGGDGEWTGKMPEPPPPESGDLHRDVPVLAAEVLARAERADAELAQARAECERLRGEVAAGERNDCIAVDTVAAMQADNERLREGLRECEAITDRLAGERSYSMGEGIDALRRVFDTLLASGGEGGNADPA